MKEHKQGYLWSNITKSGTTAPKVINIIHVMEENFNRECNSEEPNNELLVISLQVEERVVKRILVHTGSAANILYRDTFQKLRIVWNKVIPYETPLVGFTG